MSGMAFLGLLVIYTIFVLFARGAALRLWHGVRGRDTEVLLIRLPRLGDIRWGAALVPVTIGYLAVFGAFGLFNVGGTGGGNLFSAATPPVHSLSLLTVAVVAGYTLARPRRGSRWIARSRRSPTFILAGQPPAPVESAVYFAVAEALKQRTATARPGQDDPHPRQPRPRDAPRAGRRRRRGRGRSRERDRAGRDGAAARRLRWHPGSEQPHWRPDHRRNRGMHSTSIFA